MLLALVVQIPIIVIMIIIVINIIILYTSYIYIYLYISPIAYRLMPIAYIAGASPGVGIPSPPANKQNACISS